MKNILQGYFAGVSRSDDERPHGFLVNSRTVYVGLLRNLWVQCTNGGWHVDLARKLVTKPFLDVIVLGDEPGHS